MARSYRRDARGRFAGGGYSGQTGGRGARLKASGTRAGGGAKMKAGRIGGTIGKVPGKRASPKPALRSPAAKPKWEKTAGFAGRRSSAQIAKGLTGVTRDNGGSFSASIIRTGKQSQAPRMERKGFRNVTDARKWAMNPSARGDRLMRRKYGSEAAPDASGFRRKGRIANTLRKRRGLKPGVVKVKATRNYLAKTDIEQKQARAVARQRGPKNKKLRSAFIQSQASTVYRAQERLRYTGRLTPEIVKRGVPRPERMATRSGRRWA